MANKNLATFLKKKRQESGLTQHDVSHRLGYATAQFVSNWERGLSSPPVSVLRRLGDIYRVSPEELFNIYLKQQLQRVEKELREEFSRRSSRSRLN